MVGDALDPLAGVAEDAARPVDHPLLRLVVGEHLLGDRAEPDQLVAQLAPEHLERLLGEQVAVAGEPLGLVARGWLRRSARAARARPSLGREVDLLGGERALDARADRLARC